MDGVAISEPNADRLSGFYRLDARLEKRWTFGERGSISAVLEMMNTTLQKEVFSVTCETAQTCTTNEIGPVSIPSLGIEVAF